MRFLVDFWEREHHGLQNQLPNYIPCLCMQSGSLPRDWRRANVAPVFKRGNKHSCSNYRPVSLTSLVVKCLERLVYARLSEFLDMNNKLSSCQHGFRRGHSCQTQLLAIQPTSGPSLSTRVSAPMSFILISLKHLIQFHIRDCWWNWIAWGSGAISSVGLQHSFMIESREFMLKVSPLSGWRWYQKSHRGPFLGPYSSLYVSMILMLVWAQLFVSLQMTVQFLGSSQIRKTVMISRQISTGSITGHNYGSLILTNPNAKSWE